MLDFTQSESKLRARYHTIITPYHDIVKREAIPLDRCYISMCANQYNLETLELAPMSEYSQMLDEKLIQRGQFHGIDHKSDIIINNKKVLPDEHWHHGDFGRTIETIIDSGNIPSIVNIDTQYECKAAIKLLHSVMWLTLAYSDVMIVLNVIGNNYGKRATRVDTMGQIKDNFGYHQLQVRGWETYHNMFSYDGVRNVIDEQMNSFVFYKH